MQQSSIAEYFDELGQVASCFLSPVGLACTTNTLEKPISLSYHTSGIKVDEVATSVGLGWVLNAMKKTFIYTIVILGLLGSCRAQKIDQEMMYGTFTGTDTNHTANSFYILELKSDGTFSFDIKVHLGGSQCRGKWRVIDGRILLECGEVTDPMETLRRGGISGVQELQVIGKNKLKYKDVVLRRKK